MKRVRTILLFLVLGAIVNVGVAWGCALWIDLWAINDPTIRTENSSTESWELSRCEAFGSSLFRSIRAKGPFKESLEVFRTDLPASSIIPDWGELNSSSEAFLNSTDEYIYIEGRTIEGRGWPRRTVWGEYGNVEDGIGVYFLDTGTRHGMLDSPFPDWDQFGTPRVLPFFPIWRGFTINTLFYAALLWLLIPGPFVLRRAIRCKRGLCTKCAYDLKGTDHAACPECGHAQAPTAVE